VALVFVSAVTAADTSGSTANLTSPSVTPATGETLVIVAVTEDSALSFGTPPTSTANTISWTRQLVNNPASHTYGAVYTGQVTAGGSACTVTLPFTGGSGRKSMAILRFTGAQIAATPATAAVTGSGAPTGAISTAQAGSIVVCCNGDWAAVAPGTPTYVSSSGTPTEDFKTTTTGAYTAYFWHQTAASAGSQNIGISSPGGQTYNMLAIEVQDASAAAPAAPGRVYTLPSLAVQHSTTW
jgi:hypothetical protein